MAATTAHAQVTLNYEAGITAGGGSGELAPHYIMAGRGGTVTQSKNALVHAAISHTMDTTTRLSWGAGVELWGGWSSSADYAIYDTHSSKIEPVGFAHHNQSQHPSRFWLQQAYVEGKYRGVFATIGQKQHHSVVVNDQLSSGDMTMSGNARPMPGFRVGFVNFQNIPLTRGWVQINGEVGYYRMTDKNWIQNHYNYYNHFITTDYWLNYKYLHLRTKPGQRVVATVGMQAACQFGGTRRKYEKGIVTEEIKQRSDFKAFFHALIPGANPKSDGDHYYEGNHLGTWDVALDVNLDNGAVLRAYYQSPWETGSSIGKMNGFDGLYGIEYKAAKRGIVNGVVAEYIDLTNHSGPIHFAPGDQEGTTITTQATGGDDYYNNYAFTGYHALGMSIGSPMVRGPIYNLDGYSRFGDNLMRGFHLGIMGDITGEIGYRLLGSYRKSWGTHLNPRLAPVDATCIMVEGTYAPRCVAGLNVKAQFALDRGTLTGNNVGALVSVTYSGNFTLGKR